MNSKAQAIKLLNKLEDFLDTFPVGSSTMLDPYVHALRRAIHQNAGAWKVEDPRLRPLPTCAWCGAEYERGQHDADRCTRTMLKLVLERLGKPIA